jgi:xanthine dehydrogenase iron-sulfur cluster and FAD-binding subunit A
MWPRYYAPASLPEALELLAQHGEDCRIMAGGTDLILELERGVRQQQIVVDISRIPGLDAIATHENALNLGALTTHSQVAGSPEVIAGAFPLARASWLVGAPQIRNRGTVAGNLVTASPANDTITPMWALDASFTLASRDRGSRTLSCDQFFLGVRRTALAPDEMLVGISVPQLGPHERGTFLKLGLRRAQAISVVNVAVTVDFVGTPGSQVPVATARIALGSVAPTIVRAHAAEAYLTHQTLTDEVIHHAAELAATAARPISDVRAGADYRRDMVQVMTERALRQLRDGTERQGWPEKPIMLWGGLKNEGTEEQGNGRMGDEPSYSPRLAAPIVPFSGDIHVTLNGQAMTLREANGKTLLRALRENAGLTGTKEGCAEGECGACTVWLNGKAVMSCLVPAERADGCEVVTVEGLAGPDVSLHPVQEAFVEMGAVQCGYCTPGFLMSAANLLAELPHPTREQIKEALTGNLCRCTGYYKILQAIELAARG